MFCSQNNKIARSKDMHRQKTLSFGFGIHSCYWALKMLGKS